MTQQLVCDALNQAAGRAKPPRGVVCHSGRGVQYASKSYRTLLKKHGFIQSMSRKGNCWDNACMESFFGTLKTELIYHESYKTRAQARLSIMLNLFKTGSGSKKDSATIPRKIMRSLDFQRNLVSG